MKIVVQRVKEANVKVDNEIVGKISEGLMLLIGVDEDDDNKRCRLAHKKIIDLRIFSDQEGKMNLSVKDISGEILCISQFTLISDYKKGNRPSI
jgi:D-tyrosyl-tRNA(Tyr) deacylase